MQRNETNLREALRLATSSDYQTRLYAVEVLTDGIEELLLLRPTLAALTAERDAADELRQQQHRAKSIVMDSQQREIVGLREQVETLTAERDELLTDLIHFAQTNHQAHHGDHSGTWLSCDRGSCPGLRRAVSRARGDTTPPAGAQEGE